MWAVNRPAAVVAVCYCQLAGSASVIVRADEHCLASQQWHQALLGGLLALRQCAAFGHKVLPKCVFKCSICSCRRLEDS